MAPLERSAGLALLLVAHAPTAVQARARAAAPAVICTALLYGLHVPMEFVYDDRYAIVDNAVVTGSFSDARTWWRELWRCDFWGGPLDAPTSHKSFRPLTIASFRLDVLVHGLQPRALYAANVLAHCVATGLVGVLAVRLWCAGGCAGGGGFLDRQSAAAASFAAMLFAVHPVHVEAVGNIVNRAELLAACCSLAYLLVLASVLAPAADTARLLGRGSVCIPQAGARPLGLALHLCALVALGVLGALSKETGATVGLVGLALQALVLCERLARLFVQRQGGLPAQPRSLPHWARAHALIAATQLLWLVAFLRWRRGLHSTMPAFHPAHNPASHLPTTRARVANYAFAAAYSLWLLCWPSRPCPDYSAGSLPLFTRAGPADLLLGAARDDVAVLQGLNHGQRGEGARGVEDGAGALCLAVLVHALWAAPLAYCAGTCARRAVRALRASLRDAPAPDGGAAIGAASGLDHGGRSSSSSSSSSRHKAAGRTAAKCESPPASEQRFDDDAARGVGVGWSSGANCGGRGKGGACRGEGSAAAVHESGQAESDRSLLRPPQAAAAAAEPARQAALLSSTEARVAFGLVLAIAPLLPAWNLLHPVGFVVAERVLYSPSAGQALIAATLHERAVRSGSAAARAGARLAAVALLLLGACETSRQLPAWATSRALWASARTNCPQAISGVENVVVASNAAFFLRDEHPHAPAASNAAARAEAAADAATARLRRSIEWEVRYTPLHTNLCMLLGNAHRWAEALPACRQAVALDTTNPIGYVNLAAALWSVGERSSALKHARHAVALAPTDPRALGQLEALLAAGGASL